MYSCTCTKQSHVHVAYRITGLSQQSLPQSLPMLLLTTGPDTCIQASLYMAQEAEPQGSSYMYPIINMITITQKERTRWGIQSGYFPNSLT